MIRGLYTAAAGMITGLLRQETIIHNLSNIRTVGYKADRTAVTDFPSMLLTQVYKDRPGAEVGVAGTGVSLSEIATDFNKGAMRLTDHPFDFAVAGDGFFRVQTEDGVRYTRNGQFHRDSDNRLVNANGYRVLGPDGPVTIPEGLLTVSPQGEIFVDEALVGEFSLVQFDDVDNIIKEGDTLFTSRDAEPEQMAAADRKIYQGYLEDSNVDAAQAVAEMMGVLRVYQASQRLVQYQDQINQQTVTELGRV